MTALPELIVAIVERVRRLMRVAVVGRVSAWDPSTGTATVTPSVADDPTQPVVPIYGVPVLMIGGSSRGITYGLTAGDQVVTVVRHRSHDELDAGTAALPVQPAASRAMSYADAVALPGYVAPGTGRPASQVRSDGAMVIYLAPGEAVYIGSATAVFSLTRDDLLQAQLGVLKAAISAAPVVPSDGGAAFKAALVAALASWPATTASTRARVDA